MASGVFRHPVARRRPRAWIGTAAAGTPAGEPVVIFPVPPRPLLFAVPERGIVAGTAYRDVILADTPVAYWRLGEMTGTVAADEQGFLAGTYTGGVTLGLAGALAGDLNTAASFDGIDDLIAVGDSPLLSFTNNVFTFEFWAKFPAGVSTVGILGKRGSPWEYSIHKTAVGPQLKFHAWNIGGSGVYTEATQNILADDKWHHYVWAADGSNGRLYIDGILKNTVAKTTNTMGDTIRPFEVGRAGDATGALSMSGQLDEVAIYTAALPEDRIRAHYSAGVHRASVLAAVPNRSLIFAVPAKG